MADGDVLKKVAGHQAWGPGLPPDPAGAPDGQVPTTVDEEYVLASAVSDVQTVTRTLTSPEILALFTTPITLVAAEAGKVIVPIFTIAVLHVNTTGYSWGGTTLGISYPALVGLQAMMSIDLTTSWNDWEDAIACIPLGSPFLSLLEPDVLGESLIISATTGNPTDGDGTIDLTVFYRVVDVS